MDVPNHARRPIRRSNGPTVDVLLPSLKPGAYGHFEKIRDTTELLRLFHRQHMRGFRDLERDETALNRQTEKIIRDKKCKEQRTFAAKVKDRFHEKMQAYEDAVEKRREKLRQLLCSEERQYVRETISGSQQVAQSKTEEKLEAGRQHRLQRQAHLLEEARKKKMQHWINNDDHVRNLLMKKHAMEVQKVQLEQMKQNELRKETERETDKFYAALTMKNQQAQMEREVGEVVKKHQAAMETKEVLDKQIQGIQLVQQEAERLAAEEAVELVKLREQIRREEIQKLDEKRRKRDQMRKELMEQIAIHQKCIAERKSIENLHRTLRYELRQKEYDEEMRKEEDTRASKKRSLLIHQQHLKELEKERKREEDQLDQWLLEDRRMAEKKQDEARCLILKARQELQKNVLLERAQQLEYKKQEAQNYLKLQQAENELLKIACDMNARLQEETDRLRSEELKTYKGHLKKQIEERAEQTRAEKQQLERELAEGLAEEERRRQLVLQVFHAGQAEKQNRHPHKVVLEMQCPCASNPAAHYNLLAQQKNQ